MQVEARLPLRVFSYPRSGTHLLLATIHENFILPDCTDTVESAGLAWYTTGEQSATVPWAKLFCHHSPWDEAVPLGEALYLVRHPIDCLYSFWRTFEAGRPLEKWLSSVVIEQWLAHVQSFLKAGCFWVKFTDLVNRPRDVMLQIEGRFQLARKREAFTRVAGPVGWSPGEASTAESIHGSRYAERLPPEVRQRFVDVMGESYLGYQI